MLDICYVLNMNNEPLMPTTVSRGNMFIHQGKAECLCRDPYVIKMLVSTGKNNKHLTIGMDTGGKYVGTAVSDEDGNIYYITQIEVRNDITSNMKSRSSNRRNRRNRKTRYRKARWLNRKNSRRLDRFSPTMTSKIQSHQNELDDIKKILPISEVILETATFDVQKLTNPNISGIGYQKGLLYGYSNLRAYILARDNYTCQCCKGKSKDNRKDVHHLHRRCDGGTDDPNNLITVCRTCHNKLHTGPYITPKPLVIKRQVKYATQMNSIRKQLLRRNSYAIETFGYITKANRELIGLSKTHYNDAIIIATKGKAPIYKTKNIIYKRCCSKGDYQQTKGVRSELKIPTGKILGYRKFDKVMYNGTIYFIKGRMSSGYAVLMDIFGNAIKLKPMAKFVKMTRIGARKCQMIQSLPITRIEEQNIG